MPRFRYIRIEISSQKFDSTAPHRNFHLIDPSLSTLILEIKLPHKHKDAHIDNVSKIVETLSGSLKMDIKLSKTGSRKI